MKFLNIIFTLFGVVTVIFFLFQVLPGDPARMMMDQNENKEQLKVEYLDFKYNISNPNDNPNDCAIDITLGSLLVI